MDDIEISSEFSSFLPSFFPLFLFPILSSSPPVNWYRWFEIRAEEKIERKKKDRISCLALSLSLFPSYFLCFYLILQRLFVLLSSLLLTTGRLVYSVVFSFTFTILRSFSFADFLSCLHSLAHLVASAASLFFLSSPPSRGSLISSFFSHRLDCHIRSLFV